MGWFTSGVVLTCPLKGAGQFPVCVTWVLALLVQEGGPLVSDRRSWFELGPELLHTYLLFPFIQQTFIDLLLSALGTGKKAVNPRPLPE